MSQAGCTISDYEQELNALEACLAQWHGQVVIIGDWNIHFSSEYGPRGWGGRDSKNAKKVVNMMDRCTMLPIDLTDACSGPRYTYCNGQGHTSYIDHCVVSRSLVDKVRNCEILWDELINSSDHLPVRVCVNLQAQLHSVSGCPSDAGCGYL